MADDDLDLNELDEDTESEEETEDEDLEDDDALADDEEVPVDPLVADGDEPESLDVLRAKALEEDELPEEE